MKKIKNLLYHNKKVFFSFFILLTSTISLSMFLLLYNQFQKVTYKTISTYSTEFFSKIDAISLSLLDNIKESSMQMFYMSSIKNLRLEHSLDDRQRIIGLRDLGNLVSSSVYLDSLVVYNGTLDKVFSSSSTYTSTKTADYYDQEAIDILIHPRNHPYLVPIKREVDSKTCYSFLFYEKESSHHSALLVNVKGSWYESQLWGISKEDDYIIINGNGEVLVDNNNALSDSIKSSWPDFKREFDFSTNDGLILPTFFSVQPAYLYHQIPNSDWYYLKTVNFSTLAPELIFIRNVLFVSLAIVSILMIIFISYILIKVYFPLYSNRIIGQIYSGNLPPMFSFPVCLVVAEQDNFSSLQTILGTFFGKIIMSKDNKITRCAIHSCTEEQYKLFLNSPKEAWSSKLYVSLLCFSSEDLIRSSEALTELRQLSFLYPEKHILTETILQQCNPCSSFKSKDATSLESALKSGNFDEAWNLWSAIFSTIRRDNYSDFLSCIYYLNKQLNLIEAELNLKTSWRVDNILENIADMDHLHQHMKKRLLLIANTANTKKQDQLSVFADQVDQYIQSAYKDANFSPQQVAEAFQISLAYLNRQYRQSASISVSDAIHLVRIKEACTLLFDTHDSIDLIANQVGYSNVKYFFVVFKKWTGFTPNQYRTSKD